MRSKFFIYLFLARSTLSWFKFTSNIEHRTHKHIYLKIRKFYYSFPDLFLTCSHFYKNRMRTE